MEGADWLRTQLTSFGCAGCGTVFRPGNIRILAQREDLFFVDLGCAACGSEAVAVVTISVEAGDVPSAPGGDAEPVVGEDLLAMHEFLAGFDGDFRALFGDAEGG